MEYLVLAFYGYVEIEDPQREVKKHQLFLKNLDVRARIYIAFNGINGQMSLKKEDANTYMEWLKDDPRFSSIMFKIDPYGEHIYPRVAVKCREQLVALDKKPDLSHRGKHVSPEEWKKMLEERDENTLLIDVRNSYESEIGHFEGAECPDLKTFREFPRYAEELKRKKDPKKTKVMMYCTGGIRCETYSALLKEKGFKDIYQLLGGVIHYGHEMGNQHWRGKLFVFDDRLSVPISDKKHEVISHCHHCSAPCDVYYNCADMDCNALFLSCPECAERLQGCCSEKCIHAKRRRPFEKQENPKPFRKWYSYSDTKEMNDVDCCSCDQ
ncbi:MAG: putative adenylyltransferase/sulfurtransferase MoeZ [Chlamydiae bacterium]|nr:putative adenylyltransferase/sulfurtransferase MoeZ [Chlamydiota bacterium]